MILLYSLLIFIAALIIIDFSRGLRYALSADLAEGYADIRITCEYPLFTLRVHMMSGSPWITAYLFHVRVYNAPLKRKKARKKRIGARQGMRLLRAFSASRVRVSADYGLADPYWTGLVCGAVSMAAYRLPMESFCQSPDFISNQAYCSVKAHANISLGHTMLNYLKQPS